MTPGPCVSVRVNTRACIKGSSMMGSGKLRLCSALLILASMFSVLHWPGRLEAVSGSESVELCWQTQD